MTTPAQMSSRPWFRALMVSGAALLSTVGIAQAVTTINANVDTNGSLTVDGNTTLGDGGADTFAFSGATFDVANTTTVTMDGGEGAGLTLQSGTSSLDGGEGSATLVSDILTTVQSDFGGITINAPGTGGTQNVVVSVGDAAPTAAQNGNDIALEAEDDVFIDSTDDLFINADETDIASAFDTDVMGVDSHVVVGGGVWLVAGDLAPDAAPNGDDVAVEAEDDILLKSTGDTSITTTGLITLSAPTDSITIDGGEGINLNYNSTNMAHTTSSGFAIGSGGSSLGLIKKANLADGSSGWVPDGAATSFTITADAASVTATSLITVSLGANTDAGAVCSVTTRTASTSFVVGCSSSPDDGATLQYMIVN